jgi:hypothetical protein
VGSPLLTIRKIAADRKLNSMKTSKYLINGRLEEVIRLISVLALTESTFPLVSSLDNKLRGKPMSAKKKSNVV